MQMFKIATLALASIVPSTMAADGDRGAQGRPFISVAGGCDVFRQGYVSRHPEWAGVSNSSAPYPEGIYCDGAPSDRSAFTTFFGFYLCGMLGIAVHSRSKISKAPDTKKYELHFFGGKTYGPGVLFATLFSTIFSAYTVVGVPMEANLIGWIALRWLTNAIMIGWAGLVVIPRIYRMSVDRGYLSPNDFITDRYNNRLLSVLTCLLSAGSVCIYIITQFYAMREILGYISNDMYDTTVTTWVLAAIIWLSEIMGGFDATTMTDFAQSGIMFISFILLPIVVSYWYGRAAGVTDGTDHGCPNKVMLNCAEAPLGPYEDTQYRCSDPCSGGLDMYTSGCTEYTHTWFSLHPAKGFSEYFAPLQAYKGRMDSWLVNPANNMSTVGGLQVEYASKVEAGFKLDEAGCSAKKIDAVDLYNNVAWDMFSFPLLSAAFILNPHWISRYMAAKGDYSVKGANIFLSFATLITTLPGLFMGIGAAGSLAQVNTVGSNTYGWILSDTMDRGGISEAVGVLAAVSAMAAMMSTIDSALISVTNLVTREFLQNWMLYDDGKEQSDPKAVTFTLRVCKFISFIVITMSCAVSLYAPSLQDNSAVFSYLFAWLVALLWQIAPAVVLGMWTDRVSGFACLAGIAAGLATMGALFNFASAQELWGSQFAYEKDSVNIHDVDHVTSSGAFLLESNATDIDPVASNAKTYFIDYHLIAGLVNFAVCIVLSLIPGIPDTIAAFEVPARVTNHDKGISQNGESVPSGGQLTASWIGERMTKTSREPMASWHGRFFIISVPLLIFIGGVPWFGADNDNCDGLSMATWTAHAEAGNLHPVESGVMYLNSAQLSGLAAGARLGTGGTGNWTGMGTVVTNPVNIIAGPFMTAAAYGGAYGGAAAAAKKAMSDRQVLLDANVVVDARVPSLAGRSAEVNASYAANAAEVARLAGVAGAKGQAAQAAAAAAGEQCAKLRVAVFGEAAGSGDGSPGSEPVKVNGGDIFTNMSCVSMSRMHAQLGPFGCLDLSECILTNNVPGNGKMCNGPDTINGFPRWTLPIFAVYGIAMFFNAFAWMSYETYDTKPTAGGDDESAGNVEIDYLDVGTPAEDTTAGKQTTNL